MAPETGEYRAGHGLLEFHLHMQTWPSFKVFGNANPARGFGTRPIRSRLERDSLDNRFKKAGRLECLTQQPICFAERDAPMRGIESMQQHWSGSAPELGQTGVEAEHFAVLRLK